jgi:hypothetical protein
MDINRKITAHEHNIKTIKQKVWKYQRKNGISDMEKPGPHNIRTNEAAVKNHGKKDQKAYYIAVFIIPPGNAIGQHGGD